MQTESAWTRAWVDRRPKPRHRAQPYPRPDTGTPSGWQEFRLARRRGKPIKHHWQLILRMATLTLEFQRPRLVKVLSKYHESVKELQAARAANEKGFAVLNRLARADDLGSFSSMGDLLGGVGLIPTKDEPELGAVRSVTLKFTFMSDPDDQERFISLFVDQAYLLRRLCVATAGSSLLIARAEHLVSSMLYKYDNYSDTIEDLLQQRGISLPPGGESASDIADRFAALRKRQKRYYNALQAGITGRRHYVTDQNQLVNLVEIIDEADAKLKRDAEFQIKPDDRLLVWLKLEALRHLALSVLERLSDEPQSIMIAVGPYKCVASLSEFQRHAAKAAGPDAPLSADIRQSIEVDFSNVVSRLTATMDGIESADVYLTQLRQFISTLEAGRSSAAQHTPEYSLPQDPDVGWLQKGMHKVFPADTGLTFTDDQVGKCREFITEAANGAVGRAPGMCAIADFADVVGMDPDWFQTQHRNLAQGFMLLRQNVGASEDFKPLDLQIGDVSVQVFNDDVMHHAIRQGRDLMVPRLLDLVQEMQALRDGCTKAGKQLRQFRQCALPGDNADGHHPQEAAADDGGPVAIGTPPPKSGGGSPELAGSAAGLDPISAHKTPPPSPDSGDKAAKVMPGASPLDGLKPGAQKAFPAMAGRPSFLALYTSAGWLCCEELRPCRGRPLSAADMLPGTLVQSGQASAVIRQCKFLYLRFDKAFEVVDADASQSVEPGVLCICEVEPAAATAATVPCLYARIKAMDRAHRLFESVGALPPISGCPATSMFDLGPVPLDVLVRMVPASYGQRIEEGICTAMIDTEQLDDMVRFVDSPIFVRGAAVCYCEESKSDKRVLVTHFAPRGDEVGDDPLCTPASVSLNALLFCLGNLGGARVEPEPAATGQDEADQDANANDAMRSFRRFLKERNKPGATPKTNPNPFSWVPPSRVADDKAGLVIRYGPLLPGNWAPVPDKHRRFSLLRALPPNATIGATPTTGAGWEILRCTMLLQDCLKYALQHPDCDLSPVPFTPSTWLLLYPTYGGMYFSGVCSDHVATHADCGDEPAFGQASDILMLCLVAFKAAITGCVTVERIPERAHAATADFQMYVASGGRLLFGKAISDISESEWTKENHYTLRKFRTLSTLQLLGSIPEEQRSHFDLDAAARTALRLANIVHEQF